MEYEGLFRPFTLGTLELKIGSFRPCATHFQNKDGYVTDKTVRWYEDIAMGGVGLIISCRKYCYSYTTQPKYVSS